MAFYVYLKVGDAVSIGPDITVHSTGLRKGRAVQVAIEAPRELFITRLGQTAPPARKTKTAGSPESQP